MKKMTYKTLMKKVADGYAEIDAWQITGSVAMVTFWKSNGTAKREMVEVTNCPKDLENERV